MINAFKYVQAHGIVLESQYPYTAKQGTCSQNAGPFKNTGEKSVVGGCAKLYAQVQIQPTSVAVDANNW